MTTLQKIQKLHRSLAKNEKLIIDIRADVMLVNSSLLKNFIKSTVIDIKDAKRHLELATNLLLNQYEQRREDQTG